MGLLGERVRRVEDRALLTGAASFTSDVAARTDGALVAHFVRSDVAHALVRGIDVSQARRAPGVVAVVTAADADVTGTTIMPVPAELVRPLLAIERVRFPGEILAMVVAEDAARAADAAELVVAHLEPLPAVPGITVALDPTSTPLFAGRSSNVVLTASSPADVLDATAEALAAAPVVVELAFVNRRVAAAPMETNAVLARPTDEGVEVHVSTQAPHGVRDTIATLCGLAPEHVRVIAPHVGGGFGGKSMAEPEHVLVTRAALALGRPVWWHQARTESLRCIHGRDQQQVVRIGADLDGTLVALHADLVSDDGAYPGFNHFLTTLTAKMLNGPYRFAHVSSTIRSVATNSAPVLGYRGAGRPEATSLVERGVDAVAQALALDPAELRRRNLITHDRFPYETPTGAVYDRADYGRALELALAHARYDERRDEQAARLAAGTTKVLGIGVSTYVEVTAGAGPTEFADVEVHPSGRVTVRAGTFGHGQGHRTTYAQIAADALGVAFDAVDVIDGDTALVARGVGTFGSRSMQVGGSSVLAACTEVREHARRRAADLLEAAPDDVLVEDGACHVRGVPTRRLGLAELATHGALRAQTDWERPSSTYPSGAHVAIVEVDLGTGGVVLVEHVAVDDCGTLLNPMIVDGQVHGGIAQGAGQALLEEVVRDEHATVLGADLTSYLVPTAAELPSFTRVECVTPTPVNPLGAKGIGESGTIGATPAVHNAVLDALAPYGVRHLDMPCSPERVWRAIHGEHPPVHVHRREP